MKGFFFLNVILGILFIYPKIVFSQTNNTQFSISAGTGLVAANKNAGVGLFVSSTAEFKNSFCVEFSYLYSQLDKYKIEDEQFRIYKYSLAMGYTIYSNDTKFKFVGKTGPALLYFRNFIKNKESKMGLDVGLNLSYNILKKVNLGLGLNTTFNKVTDNFVQSFVGFEYQF